MKFVYEDGTEVRKRDSVISFRGDEYVVTGWREPHKVSSTGRIFVRACDTRDDCEFFPSVFGMKWEGREVDHEV